MKTLDEVIFEAPYSPTPWEADALNYLKEYKDDKDELNITRLAYLDILTDYVALKNFWAEQQANPPLTWDELCKMEATQVWLEWSSDGDCGEWVLIAYMVDNDIKFFRYGDDRCLTLTRDEYEPDKWQAYRKERK